MAKPKPLAPQPDQLPLAAGGADAPLIFFDQAMTFGIRNAVAHITLEAFSYASVDGRVRMSRVVAVELRTGLQGLRTLKAAIEAIELLASQTHSGAEN